MSIPIKVWDQYRSDRTRENDQGGGRLARSYMRKRKERIAKTEREYPAIRGYYNDLNNITDIVTTTTSTRT